MKEINVLEYENDLEKLESGRWLVKEYEEMLWKVLVMVIDFFVDGGSEDDRVNIVDFFVYFVGLEKDFYSV